MVVVYRCKVKGEQKMTKKEMAKKVAEHMNSINKNVDIERMTAVLTKGMTTNELKKLVERHEG